MQFQNFIVILKSNNKFRNSFFSFVLLLCTFCFFIINGCDRKTKFSEKKVLSENKITKLYTYRYKFSYQKGLLSTQNIPLIPIDSTVELLSTSTYDANGNEILIENSHWSYTEEHKLDKNGKKMEVLYRNVLSRKIERKDLYERNDSGELIRIRAIDEFNNTFIIKTVTNTKLPRKSIIKGGDGVDTLNPVYIEETSYNSAGLVIDVILSNLKEITDPSEFSLLTSNRKISVIESRKINTYNEDQNLIERKTIILYKKYIDLNSTNRDIRDFGQKEITKVLNMKYRNGIPFEAEETIKDELYDEKYLSYYNDKGLLVKREIRDSFNNITEIIKYEYK